MLITKPSLFHQVQSGFNTWLYAVEGDIEYQLGGYWASLKQGSSIALTFEQLQQLTVRGTASKQSHFVVMSGEPIKEAFVQQESICYDDATRN